MSQIPIIERGSSPLGPDHSACSYLLNPGQHPAQQQIADGNQDRGDQRAAKSVDPEAVDQLVRDPQEEGIQDEEEQPQGHDDQGK